MRVLGLQARAAQLERSMARKDREIAELTAELRILEEPRRPAGGRGNASPERGGSSGGAEGPAAPDALPAGRDFVRLCLQSQAARLSQLAVAHDLHHADPSGEAPIMRLARACQSTTVSGRFGISEGTRGLSPP